jgi:nucleotide-binding universal stress UspA family protein
MFERILVPTDGSELSTKAIEKAVDLARILGSKVYGLTVQEPYPWNALAEYQPPPPPDYQETQTKLALERLAAVQKACEHAGVRHEVFMVQALNPWQTIVDMVREREIQLIVMGSHGRKGMSALLLGSETQKVLTHSQCPVLVVR